MRVFILIFFVLAGSGLLGQPGKPVINTGVLGKWPGVEKPSISPNGNYVCYRIYNHPTPGHYTLVVQSTSSSWKKTISGNTLSYGGEFSADSRLVVFQAGDSLCLLTAGSDQMKVIPGIKSWKYGRSDPGNWLAYQLKGNKGELVLLNLVKGTEQRFAGVSDYGFDDRGNVMAIQSRGEGDALVLQWVNLRDGGKATTIWSAAGNVRVSKYVFDASGDQLAFMVQHNKKDNELWYYRAGMDKGELRVNDRSAGIANGLQLKAGSLGDFSISGQYIFFKLEQIAESRKPGADAVKVDVWSYKDIVLQPAQMVEVKNGPESYAAVVSRAGNRVVQLEKDDDWLITVPRDVAGDYVQSFDNSNVPYWWPHDRQASLYLVSLIDGSRQLLKKEVWVSHSCFSPGGRYFMYWDPEEKGYCSYEVSSGKKVNITGGLAANFTNEHSRGVNSGPVSTPVGWYKDDRAFLFYDNYDIWKLDPSGVNPPLNLTRGYGAKHKIKLRLANERDQEGGLIIYSGREQVLLSGFNVQNMENGFFQADLSGSTDPKLLTMGPYTYDLKDSQKAHPSTFGDGMPPLKAVGTNAWIVERHSATEAPNYFFTSDFTSYRPLSDLAPQKAFNWLTSELVTYQQLDGTLGQGVLYKPENFDPRKQYPVIFTYYEKLSHRLNQFTYPFFTYSNINIPWFVSNGYLVFTPDIHYSVASESGKTNGACAYNAVEAAARYLASFSYVDGKRMAVYGHSFGGGETNYIISHSRLFAAAVEAAGGSDPISSYLTLTLDHRYSIESDEKQVSAEMGQGRYGMDATPWKYPELYRDQSAVLNADKITAPLLIMHNKGDVQIRFDQGLELFMALRRLGKPVWLLQYDEGGHAVNGKDANDYTMRLTQFFDHYLKGAPPARWMTAGIPARLKGIETGLETDASTNKPKK